MLASYNMNPFDIKASKISFREVYEQWSAIKYQRYPSRISTAATKLPTKSVGCCTTGSSKDNRKQIFST
jgi:hypothetical protein